jgi:hypothetical protein
MLVNQLNFTVEIVEIILIPPRRYLARGETKLTR